jgi:hypothetical protein
VQPRIAARVEHEERYFSVFSDGAPAFATVVPNPARFAMNVRARASKQTKFIFVTGGVVSSLGKGLASASIASLLESRGLKVTISSTPTSTSIPGTMSPFQHGEVFVTDDGAETDLDLGHYERFTARA